MKKRFVLLVALSLVTALLASGIAVAGPGDKVDVCHREGNGSYILINISDNAFDAHIDHGDASPGDPVPGMAGYVFGEDCEPESAAILVWSSVMNFSGTGAGGWSCPPENPNVIDGGVSKSNTDFVPADHPVYQVAAEPGAILTTPYGTWTYPYFAHYTYGSWYPGETGWAVVNGGTAQSLYVYVYCVE